MHPHALGIGKCIAKLEESNVGVLCNQFFEKGLMWCQLSLTRRRSLASRFGMAFYPHLPRPPRTSCR